MIFHNIAEIAGVVHSDRNDRNEHMEIDFLTALSNFDHDGRPV